MSGVGQNSIQSRQRLFTYSPAR